MRTLHDDLKNAQTAATRSPVVSVVVRNDIGVVRRLDFDQLDATSNADGKHDTGLTADGALHRVRAQAGAIKYQRVADPAAGPFNAWTDLATGMGSSVALAAWGTRVLVVYNDGAGTGIRFRESSDSGVTFSADAALFTSAFAVGDLAAAYTNTSGDAGVAWVTVGTANAYLRIRTAGAWGALLTSPHAVHGYNGVALVRGLFWELVLTGNEVTTQRPTVWSQHYNPAAGTWSAIWPQVQGETAETSFGNPFVTFSDTWRVNFVEAPLYSGGTTRVYRSWVHPSSGFDAGPFTWRTPAPTSDTNLRGVALCHDGTFTQAFVYESGLAVVRRASTASIAIDLSAGVLALELDETPRGARGYIDLLNDHGQYALDPGGDGSYPPNIRYGARVLLSLGYETASGPRTSQLPDLWVAGFEHRIAGGHSRLRILVEGALDLLRRSTQRTTIAHTADTYTVILDRLFARAGLDFVVTGGSSRLSAVTPAFSIDPGTSGHAALFQALAFVEDRVRMTDDGTAVATAYSSAGSPDYAFADHSGFDGSTREHFPRALELRHAPHPVTEAQAFGDGAFGQDLDLGLIAYGAGEIERQRDLTSNTGAEAAATAAAHRRTRQLDGDAGRLVAHPNVGLQLYDVVQLNAGPLSPTNEYRRVSAIRWRYDNQRAIYEQEVRLSPR